MSNVTALLCLAIEFAILAVIIAGFWKMFEKAGKPGWAALIPVYNVIVMLEIAGKPIWWIALFFIPIANIVIAILMYVELAKCFGKGPGFAVGMALLPFIFVPLLGFGDARYLGPEGSPLPPRRRRPDDDFEDEDDHPRSRRRSRDDYDDDEGIVEDRPRRRSREDDEDRFRSDEPAPRKAPAPPQPAAPQDGTVLIQCTACRKNLKVPGKVLGKKVKCPSCAAVFVAG